MTNQQLETIAICAFVKNMDTLKICEETGFSRTTIIAATTAMREIKAGDWEALRRRIKVNKSVRAKFLKQVEQVIGVEIPADVHAFARELNVKDHHPEQPDPPTEAKQELVPDICMKMLSQMAKQTELLKAILETTKCYGAALASQTQTIIQRQQKIEAAITDAEKSLAGDLKDNINANADVLRNELAVIKLNSRKKGL